MDTTPEPAAITENKTLYNSFYMSWADPVVYNMNGAAEDTFME